MKYEDVALGQEVWSITLGKGKVVGKATANQPDQLSVQHGAQLWQYDGDLVRTGNRLPDLLSNEFSIYLNNDIESAKERNLIDDITALVVNYDNSI